MCLLLGYAYIRKKNIAAHRACMLTAFGASSLFLVTYLMHHAQVGSVPFRGQGLVRWVYLSILIPHIVLAAGIVPLALLTLYRGYTGRVASHRKIARYTLPIWLYVSISGVVVYCKRRMRRGAWPGSMCASPMLTRRGQGPSEAVSVAARSSRNSSPVARSIR